MINLLNAASVTVPMTEKFIKIGLISISDRASSGVYEDQGIPALRDWLGSALKTPWEHVARIIPDEQDEIEAMLRDLITQLKTAEREGRIEDVRVLNGRVNEMRLQKAGRPLGVLSLVKGVSKE